MQRDIVEVLERLQFSDRRRQYQSSRSDLYIVSTAAYRAFLFCMLFIYIFLVNRLLLEERKTSS